MRISPYPLSTYQAVHLPQPATTSAPDSPALSRGGETTFGARLTHAVQEVDALQHAAEAQIQRLAAGEAESLQGVVIAVERADLALELTIQVTQRAVEAYQEISRMQV